MWILTLLFLMSWNGAFGSRELCRERVSSVCLDSVARPSYPETEDELESVCIFLQSTFNCIKNYDENCGSEGLGIAEVNEINVYSDALAEVCRKDSQLHHNVVQNLRCLKDIFQHAEQRCLGFTRNAINHLYEQVMKGGRENADDNHVYKVFDCLYVAVQAHCFVTQTAGKCGTEAKNAVLEIMKKARLVDEECPASVQNEVLELLNILAVATKEEVHVRRLFERKK